MYELKKKKKYEMYKNQTIIISYKQKNNEILLS